jgi:hypothetical protein
LIPHSQITNIYLLGLAVGYGGKLATDDTGYLPDVLVVDPLNLAHESHWQNSAVKDYQTINNLFNSQDYHWTLFIGHLVIEQLLKAVYVKNIDINPPKTHKLAQLAERSLHDSSPKRYLHIISLKKRQGGGILSMGLTPLSFLSLFERKPT